MRILDRSSRHGEGLASGHRYERIQARDNRAHPGILGRYRRGWLFPSHRRIRPAELCRHRTQALWLFPLAQRAARGAVCLPATPDGLFTPASVPTHRAVSRPREQEKELARRRIVPLRIGISNGLSREPSIYRLCSEKSITSLFQRHRRLKRARVSNGI